MSGTYQLTVKNGRRNSAARAFLRPAMKRPNVTVKTRAHVTRILTEGTRAVGVEYRHNGALRQARAREVILAGGAINTPQLLMLSGIGPGRNWPHSGCRCWSTTPMWARICLTIRASTTPSA